MNTIDYFHYNFFHHDQYENLSSGNNATSDSLSTDSSSYNWLILILSVSAVFGTLGNLLVCASIALDKQLQTSTNWFLFSLAIADCLVSLIVLPLSIIKDFHGSWQLPILLCNLFVFLDVLLCTTSIWHLTILSIDRFLHISRPFRSRDRSKRKTLFTILCIWTCSIAISCTILVLGFTNEDNIIVKRPEDRRYCVLNNRSFIIYGSIVCFCIPCILMLVTYSLTIRRLQSQAEKCYTDPEDNLMINSPKSDRLRRHFSSSKRRTRSTEYKKAFIKEISSSNPASPTTTDLQSWPVSSLTSLPSSPANQRSFFQNTLVKKAVHAIKGGTETTSERRAMKVLGIVFIVFLVAWLPFSILNILAAVCPDCGVQASLLNVTSWLGYISSNLNPIIYTAFNVRFRRAFVSILTCQSSYFSHKRKRNNLYIFVAMSNQQPLPADHEQYFRSSQRSIKERRSKQRSFN